MTAAQVESNAGELLDAAEVERQVALLTGPAPTLALRRPATVGDGLRQLDDAAAARAEDAHDRARRAGRIQAFVPASGAATRLCRDLLAAWRNPGDARALGRIRTALDHAPQLAVWSALAAHGARPGDPRSILDAMLGPDGLALQDLPKGLIPFHHGPEGPRTAFVEHLVEAVRLGRDDAGVARAHFTVGVDHQSAFEAASLRARAHLEPTLDVRLDVRFSVQDPRTDTVAVDAAGRLVRHADGSLLLRPGGHGALLRNLAALGADVALVKNIDNVLPEHRRAPALAWRRRLAGLLVDLQGRAHALVRALRRGDQVEAARAFVRAELGLELPADAPALLARLDRPWRVCGIVPNEGQPGGGPFWAASPDGVSLQIVESAQVSSDPAQQALLGGATHFNPVDMALGLRDADGRPHDLTRFTDPGAVIVTEKSHEGRPIRVLEHPGLWNGGMARWNSVFVEIPASTFQPVKTLADLLKSGHGGPLP